MNPSPPTHQAKDGPCKPESKVNPRKYIQIGAPAVSSSESRLRIEFPLQGLAYSNLWYEVPAEFEALLSLQCDAALVALLLPAMRAGLGIKVLGPLSPKLAWSARGPLQSLLSSKLSCTHRVPLLTKNLQIPESTRTHILTGLSCGIDSLSVVYDHLLTQDYPEQDKITHFLFNDVGGHGHIGDTTQRETLRLSHAQALAEQLGRPLIHVRSNVDAFYPEKSNSFYETHQMRNSSVALLLQKNSKRWLYASAFHWLNMNGARTNELSSSDPILLPALSTESLDLASAGAEWKRTEKTATISNTPLFYDYLDVCSTQNEFKGANCSVCEKCMRTQLCLEILGRLDSFNKVFSRELYLKNRTQYLIKMLSSPNDTWTRELTEIIREHAFKVPATIHIQAFIYRVLRTLPGGLRQRLVQIRNLFRPRRPSF